MSNVKELTLNIRNWRCGGNDTNQMHGTGTTALLNSDGYMCCLGQFAEQANFPLEGLMMAGLLEDIPKELLEEYSFQGFIKKECSGKYDAFVATRLANELVHINDHAYVDLIERVERIRTKLAEHNIKLNVVDELNELGTS